VSIPVCLGRVTEERCGQSFETLEGDESFHLSLETISKISYPNISTSFLQKTNHSPPSDLSPDLSAKQALYHIHILLIVKNWRRRKKQGNVKNILLTKQPLVSPARPGVNATSPPLSIIRPKLQRVSDHYMACGIRSATNFLPAPSLGLIGPPMTPTPPH
jgi:hypothetical protein